MKRSEDSSLLIAGGGTGGHVLAGIAVADSWSDRYSGRDHVLFIGTQGKIEEKLVPRAGYSLRTIRIGALNKVGLKRIAQTSLQLPIAFFQSIFYLLKVRPRYVLGVGGYSSGPVLLMARLLCSLRLLHSTIGILEQNAVPGMTNRILGKFAHIIFTAFPEMEQWFPGKKVILTGNPIRSSIRPMVPAARDPFTIFVFGGSQGAIGVNTLVLEALPHLKDLETRVKWIHQTGEKDFDRVKEGYTAIGWPARVEKFIFDMPAVYANASLLVCRAGSSTLSEIAAVGRAALLIPLPTAANNHQEQNAKKYTDAGASLLIRQEQTSGKKLAKVIRDLVMNLDKVTEMEKKVTRFFCPHAAEDLIEGFIHDV